MKTKKNFFNKTINKFIDPEVIKIFNNIKNLITSNMKTNTDFYNKISESTISDVFYIYILSKAVRHKSLPQICNKKLVNIDNMYIEKSFRYLLYSHQVYNRDIINNDWLYKNVIVNELTNISVRKKKNIISYFPRYTILTDHLLKSIVITIRGTDSIADIIIDLSCDHKNFMGGKIHSGFLEAATVLHKKIKTDLRKIKNVYPDYKLTVTGHSLAGAVSLILSLLIRKDKFKGEIEVYTYGTPPFFFHSKKSKLPVLFTENNIYSYNFIHYSDIIPRLSIYNLCLFLEKFLIIKSEFNLTSLEKSKYLLNMNTNNISSDLNSIFLNIKKIYTKSSLIKWTDLDYQIPGNLFLLYPEKNNYSLKNVNTFELSKPLIIIDNTSQKDHSCINYIKAFKQIV